MSLNQIYKPIECNYRDYCAYEKNLDQIYSPIKKDLYQVEIELKKQINSIAMNQKDADVINYLFNIPGKRLRPALVLLSAGSVNEQRITNHELLISLATAVELIHSASLIHDDIVDNSTIRRNKITLNEQFGNKIAVLAGDILYAYAFSLLTDKFDKRILRILSKCVEKMCCGEIRELRITNYKQQITCEEYLKIIEDKTASFMSACCQCGAILHSTDEKLAQSLADYGFILGMSFQIIDDYIDSPRIFDQIFDTSDSKSYILPRSFVQERGLPISFYTKVQSKDSIRTKDIALCLAEEFASKAKRSIKKLKNSIYKEKLFDLVDYILN